MAKRHGQSYQKRVADVNRIYDQYSRSGLSNREIWKRYIYPVYAICEKTFYNMLKNPQAAEKTIKEEGMLFFDFFNKEDEQRRSDYYKKNP